jgi:hypothetical protein
MKLDWHGFTGYRQQATSIHEENKDYTFVPMVKVKSHPSAHSFMPNHLKHM